MSRKYFLILILIFVFGFLVRVLFLPQNALTFGYDQARDAYRALEIAHGHLKIFGPPASQPGLFHGVFYYYFLAPAYLLGQGSPIIAAHWTAFFNALTIFIVFAITYFMTKKFLPAFLASFLFAISFEATQYATWLSNPTIAIWTVPLMYLGLWLWAERPERSRRMTAPILTAIALGLSIQAEIFLAYHTLPVIIWLFIARKNITKKQLLIFASVLLATLSTMILAQIKFGIAPTITAIQGLTVSSETNLAYAKSIGDYLVLYLNQIGRIFAFNSYPGNIGYGGGFVIFLLTLAVFQARNVKNHLNPKLFVVTWLLSHLSVVTMGGSSTPFLMVGIGPAVSIIIAIFLAEWYKKYKVIVLTILAVLVFGNLTMIFKENPKGSTLFSIQTEMTLKHQLPAIDYTYNQSDKKQFSINTITSPLWVNIVWTYLYNWYGQSHYRYVPHWTGKGQEGQIATLAKSDSLVNNHFLIIEPLGGIPTKFVNETLAEENGNYKMLDENNFGQIKVIKYGHTK